MFKLQPSESAGKNSKPDVTIIGPGAVGCSLAAALSDRGYTIRSVISRNPDLKTGRLPRQISICRNFPELSEEMMGSLVFITTPDNSIAGVANKLACAGIDWREKMAVHCSGLLTSEELSALAEAGAGVASFHPLQTFAENSGPGEFCNIHISIEGDSAAAEVLQEVASDLDSEPVLLNQQQKSMLHISAVFLSNYLVTLGEIADSLIRSAIPGRDMRLLGPLLAQTAGNLERLSPQEALTGPVARGDTVTIRKHIQRLGGDEEILKIYKVLGRETLKLAVSKGTLSESSAKQLHTLLDNGD